MISREEFPINLMIADNKWFTRVVVAVIIQTLDSLRLKHPEVGPEQTEKTRRRQGRVGERDNLIFCPPAKQAHPLWHP